MSRKDTQLLEHIRELVTME